MIILTYGDQMNPGTLPNAPRRLNQLTSYDFILLSVSILFVSITVFVTFAVAKTPDNTEDPGQLIQAMSESLRSLSYEGTFVTLSGTVVDTLKIKHVNDGTETHEQLISLNGETREIFRNSELVTCIWPNSQSVITMKTQERIPGTGYDFTLNNNYHYRLLPEDRIAGRETFVVEIVADDTKRFSYRVWIDKETKMLLKSMSLDDSGIPIEQVMFTDIRFGRDITIDNVSDKLEHLEFQTQDYTEASAVSYSTEKKVRFDVLPKGYRKVSEMNHPMPTVSDPVRHIFLTDGMASISVYVQFDYHPSDDSHVGLSKLGGIAAFGRRTGTAFTTVMGDVPAQTVRAVAHAVNIKD